MNEHTEYRDIQGFEGRYKIGADGSIFSTPDDGKKDRLLKFDESVKKTTSYYRVTLSIANTQTRVLVHRLVAQAFIPNPQSKPHINHIDNDGTNNRVSNLEWCTPAENMQHSARQGRLKGNPSEQFFIASQLANDKQRKPVSQLDLNNNLIREFESISDAESYLNTRSGKSKISLVCRGLRNTYKGFKWKFT